MRAVLILSISMMFWAYNATAQINLEASYNHSGTYTHLSESGYKFYLMDAVLNQCRVYNPDHSLWKTIGLPVPANHYLYDIKYVSENLFFTGSQVALAYTYYSYDEVNQYYTYTTRLIREDGNELLLIPGCGYIQLIEMPDIGTKMLAYVYDYSVFPSTVQTLVYNLPGILSTSGEFLMPLQSVSEVFPNPARDFATIAYSVPGHVRANLVITDAGGSVLRNQPLIPGEKTIRIETGTLPAGIYSFSVISGNQRWSSGKFVVK